MNLSTFNKPPLTVNPSGEERKTGYEFEFTGIDLEEIAGLISELYGGTIQKISTYIFEVQDTDLGTFKLELDAQLLRDKKYERLLKTVGFDLESYKEKDAVEDSLKGIASAVVPFEIITPPIPLSSMKMLNKLVDKLREHKAKGTGSSFIYAFGLHLNPEIPDESAESLLNHLRAYVMLDPWIRKDADVNISRKITPFINEYEAMYIQHILNPDYRPDLNQLIGDYFVYGNSRNRPLDMLPVFMYLNETLTSGLIKDTITASRPTYHYRLPNCSLEDENWSLAAEWNRWVLVEKMAANEKVLNQYSRAWLKMRKDTLIGFENKWVELMSRWVKHVV